MPSVVCMRKPATARLLLGYAMILAGLGLLVVGVHGYVERSALAAAALDGARMISPASYVAPWAMAVVLMAAAVHLIRGVRDRVF